MLSIGSLFSGIGGLERGLESSGLGPVVWQCERDPYRRAVLARHWPAARRFVDVRRLVPSELPRVGLLCGGFPCQDVSSAGKKTGLSGARSGLWYEFARVAAGLRPSWIVVENVASGAKLWLDAVRGDLDRLGYASLPVPIEAADVGALHRRARIFIVAHAHDAPHDARAGLAEVAGTSAAPGPDVSDAMGSHDGRAPAREGLDRARRGDEHRGCAARARSTEPSWAGGWFAEPDVVRVVHGVSDGLDDVAVRTERISALGDSVVPQCAEVVGWVIRELMETNQ